MKKNPSLILILVAGLLMAGAIIFLLIQNIQIKAYNRQLIKDKVESGVMFDSMRRGDLESMMSNAFEKIEVELKDNPLGTISDESIARITALSYLFKPHTYYRQGSLISKMSPERGQLLLLLSGTKIDSGSLSKIMLNGTFAHAVLTNADLSGANLKWCDLTGADLRDANLEGADLYESILKNANLWGANLQHANLAGADLTRANGSWANLNKAKLNRANLNGSRIESAQLRNADLRSADLQWAELNNSFLQNADLTDANLFRTSFIKANLEGCIMKNANLDHSYLTEANLSGANLSGAKLSSSLMEGLIILEKNWIDLLFDWGVKGAKEVQSKYRVVNVGNQHTPFYQLDKINK